MITRLGWVSGVGALAFLAFSLAAPVAASVPSHADEALALPLPEARAAAPEPVPISTDARQAAVDACLQQNEFGPARALEAVADGLGDWLVWVQDREGDLWSCNADASGLVYVNVLIDGDLLDGRGWEFLPPPSPATPASFGAAAASARDLCVGVAGLTQSVTVVSATADGVGDTLVWLRLADGQLWMCNASAEGKLFVLEPVGIPMDVLEDAPKLSAEVPGI